MSRAEVDDYLSSVEEPKRSTLEAVRRSILRVVPDAEECISYGVPGFRLDGQTVAGFAAFKDHVSYLPHSGWVLGQLTDELAGYQTTKGALHLAPDEPLPDDLVRRLVETRLQELGLHPG